jgi:hypothetical protein
MPKPIPFHQAIRDELRGSVNHAWNLNGQLEVVVAVKVKQQGTFHGKVDFSQPPWHAPVANAITDLHAMAREMEAWLRLSQGLPRRDRGGSSENTRRALENVVRLSEAAQDGTVRGHRRDMDRWNRQAKAALGQAEMPKKLPRQPGEAERACPFCKKHTLRMTPLGLKKDEQIKCIDPSCEDDEGRRPTAQVEYFQGELILRWMDGVIGLP